MSHSFYISPIHDLNYHEIESELGISYLTLTDGESIPDDGRWPRNTIYIFIDNVSTRPLEISYEDDTFQIRLFQASSIEDYHLALDFAKLLAAKFDCDIRPEADSPMGLEAFESRYGRQWARDHCHTMVDMMIDLQQHQKTTLKLMGTRSELKVGSRFIGQLLQKRDSLYETFFSRFRRLNYIDREDVFIASKIHIANKKETKRLSLVVLGEDVCTLLPASADAVALTSNKGKQVTVGFEDLVRLIEGEAEWLGEDHLLTIGYSGRQFARLAKAAKRYSPGDIFDLGHSITTAERIDKVQSELPVICYKSKFGEREWEEIIHAPFIIFIMTAAVSGGFNRGHVKSFVKFLKKTDNPLMNAVMQTTQQPANEIAMHLFREPEKLAEKLKEIVERVDAKLPAQYSIAFKTDLFVLAKKVAQSTSGFGPFGKKIPKMEKSMLDGIVLILNLPKK